MKLDKLSITQNINNNTVKSKLLPVVLSLVISLSCGDLALGKEKSTGLLKGQVLKQQIQEYIKKDVMNDRDWYYEDIKLHKDMKQTLAQGYKLIELKSVFENTNISGGKISYQQQHELDMTRITYKHRINNHIDEVYRYVKLLLQHLYYYKVQLLIHPEMKTIRKMNIHEVDNKIIEFYKLTDDLIQLEKSISTQN